MPVASTAFAWLYGPILLWLAAVLIAATVLFLIGLISVVRNRRNRPRQSRNAMILALALAFASVAGVLGYGIYDIYATENAWHFTYSISLGANGTEPESVVIPIPKDEGLLAGLHLTSGTANWSVVDTPKGRGLYIRFTRFVGLDASFSLFPPPSPLPDTSPSLTDSPTATEYLRVWVYYPGGMGGRLDLAFPDWNMQTLLVPGWISVGVWPNLPPLA